MDSDFENELKERETIVDDLKKIETEKKDLEIALEEARKELSDIQGESSKNKQILRGVAGEVLWYPKSDFDIVTRVTPDL